MAFTREQALAADEFHDPLQAPCGGKKSNRWRRNGKTKLWKRNPLAFAIPVKFGFYDYGVITEMDMYSSIHVADDCPAKT